MNNEIALQLAPDVAQTSDMSEARSEDKCEGTTDWLLCTANAHRFALPLQQVVEAMRMLPLESVMGAPPIVLGVSVIRGVPTPVIDAAVLFGGRSERCERFVTVRTGPRTVAFAVDAVIGVWTTRAALDELPPLLHEAEAIAGLRMRDRDLFFLLDVARAAPDDAFDLDMPGEGAHA
jgi:purine-binding chemotaxis protein CheW